MSFTTFNVPYLIKRPNVTTGNGSPLFIEGSFTTSGIGGSLNITSGYGSTIGGDINITASGNNLGVNTRGNVNTYGMTINDGFDSLSTIQVPSITNFTTMSSTTTVGISTIVAYSPELGLYVSSLNPNSPGTTILNSTDGVNWTSVAFFSGSGVGFGAIAWSPTLRIFSTSGSYNYTSNDGVNWTLRNTNIGQNVYMAWIENLQLFFTPTGGAPLSQISRDGINWTTVFSHIAGSFAYSPELGFIMIIANSNISISYDAINWTLYTVNINFGSPFLNSLTWSPELNIFSCVRWSNSSLTGISSDGFNWTTSTIGEVFNINLGIAWSNSLSLFFVNKRYSTNGITWTTYTIANPSLSALWNSRDGRLLIGGQSLRLITNNNLTYNKFINIGTRNATETTNIYGRTTNVGLGGYDTTIGKYSYNVNIGPTINNISVNGPIVFTSMGTSMNINNINLGFTTLTTIQNNVSNNFIYSTSNNFVSAPLTSLVYAPELGLFIAVGNNGTVGVMTSPNGQTWTSRISPLNQWSSICWSSDLLLLVAVAKSGTGDRVMTSSNGTTWTSRFSAVDNDWSSVCWSQELGLFAAVSNSGTTNRCMTSNNGINWLSRVTPNASYSSICWSPQLLIFCAVGQGATSMTSSDGINWISRTNVNASHSSVCWSPQLGLFISVNTSGTTSRVSSSTDGVVWTARTTTTNVNWSSVVWSPQLSLFCAVGPISPVTTGINNIMTSVNGITWSTRAPYTSGFENISSIEWSPQLAMFCAVSAVTSAPYTSLGSLVYSQVINRTINIGSNGSSDVFINGRNLTIGQGTVNMNLGPNSSNINVGQTSGKTTIDGKVVFNDSSSQIDTYNTNLSFTTLPTVQINALTSLIPRTLLTNTWNDVAWSPKLNLFVAVSLNGATSRVATSSDGIIWSTVTSPVNSAWNSIIWVKELEIFCAVGSTGTNNNIMTSSDGTTWTTRAGSTGSWNSITWSPDLELFCAVSTATPSIMTSSDASTWTTRLSPLTSNQWYSVSWSPKLGMFASVSFTGTDSRVMTSYNGITWTTRSSDTTQSWSSLTWSDELSLFCAVPSAASNGLVMRSSDGIIWSTSLLSIAATSSSYISWSPNLSTFLITTQSNIYFYGNGTNWTSRSGNGIKSTWSPELSMFAITDTGTNKISTTNNQYPGITKNLNIGTNPVSTTILEGKNITIGRNANTINIGQYANDIFIGGNNYMKYYFSGIQSTTLSTTTNYCFFNNGIIGNVNIGSVTNGYNTSNGRFYSPVKGIYNINVSVMSDLQQVETKLFINKVSNSINSTIGSGYIYRPVFTTSSLPGQNVMANTIVNMLQGDYIEIVANNIMIDNNYPNKLNIYQIN